jgi:hypothetical protein
LKTKTEVGDCAKLREALKKCLLYITCAESVGIGTITLNDKVKLDPKKIIKSAKAALAAPPRNCDVGSAKEQAKRMDAYCASYGDRIGGGWRCDNCPLCPIDRCELAWAQMPYEEGGAK